MVDGHAEHDRKRNCDKQEDTCPETRKHLTHDNTPYCLFLGPNLLDALLMLSGRMADPRGVWRERCFLIRDAAMPRLKNQLIINAQQAVLLLTKRKQHMYSKGT